MKKFKLEALLNKLLPLLPQLSQLLLLQLSQPLQPMDVNQEKCLPLMDIATSRLKLFKSTCLFSKKQALPSKVQHQKRKQLLLQPN